MNREPILRRRLDHAHIAQADERHVERARDGSGRHGQHIHVLAHLLQALFVRHAEALLFVHDEQAEIVKLHVLGKQPVRADDHVHLSGFQFF